jgi:hypothetical protein
MPNGRHVLVEDAGHAVYRDKPEAVLKALRDMISKPGNHVIGVDHAKLQYRRIDLICFRLPYLDLYRVEESRVRARIKAQNIFPRR